MKQDKKQEAFPVSSIPDYAFNVQETMEFAKKHTIPVNEEEIILANLIIQSVAEVYRTGIPAILSKLRKQSYVEARCMIVYFLVTRTKLSFETIGMFLSNDGYARDHSSVTHMIAMHENLSSRKQLAEIYFENFKIVAAKLEGNEKFPRSQRVERLINDELILLKSFRYVFTEKQLKSVLEKTLSSFNRLTQKQVMDDFIKESYSFMGA